MTNLLHFKSFVLHLSFKPGTPRIFSTSVSTITGMYEHSAARLLEWLDTHSQQQVMGQVMAQLDGSGLASGSLSTAAAVPVCLPVRGYSGSCPAWPNWIVEPAYKLISSSCGASSNEPNP